MGPTRAGDLMQDLTCATYMAPSSKPHLQPTDFVGNGGMAVGLGVGGGLGRPGGAQKTNSGSVFRTDPSWCSRDICDIRD